MNTELRKKAKNDFEKDFFKLMNKAVSGYQTCNNRSKKELFSVRIKLSYNKFFSQNLLAIEMKRTQILNNKPVYLGLLILEISEIVMHKFWHDYIKPKYG